MLHSNLSMVRQRIYGILADYEDQNDHDALRSDPAFKLVCDRLPNGLDLASQPTLSRFHPPRAGGATRSRSPTSGGCGTTSPPRITLDMDAFDDLTHGQQQLIFISRLLRAVPVPADRDHLCGIAGNG